MIKNGAEEFKKTKTFTDFFGEFGNLSFCNFYRVFSTQALHQISSVSRTTNIPYIQLYVNETIEWRRGDTLNTHKGRQNKRATRSFYDNFPVSKTKHTHIFLTGSKRQKQEKNGDKQNLFYIHCTQEKKRMILKPPRNLKSSDKKPENVRG